MSLTEDDLESIAAICILFGEARRAAVKDSSNGKLALAFMTASLATTLPTDAVRLIHEVERCRAEKQELIRRLEGLMDDWYDRSNEARREARPGPCTEASTLEDCAEELGTALDEMEGKITPGA